MLNEVTYAIQLESEQVDAVHMQEYYLTDEEINQLI